ncbi:MAG: hypothetical protein KJ060_03880 [Candidatus Hydrogenedentes bacterium]|nr:hypothetical protein [Candidatus Hydrogenedentota bacterium]
MDGRRVTWPGVSADQYVTIISRLDGQTTAELSIALVLLCAYAEFLLEVVLQDILRKWECPEICAQLILDHRDRFKVFKGLTGVSVESGFRDAAVHEFYPVWSRIRRERNRFAHGWPQVPGDDNIAEIRHDVIRTFELIEPAFVSLSNYFAVEVGKQPNG